MNPPDGAVQPGLLPLPWEMVVHILSFLRPRDLCSLALVSTAMNEESCRNDLWRPMCDPDWALVPADQCTPLVPPPQREERTAAPPPAPPAAVVSAATASNQHQATGMEEGWWKKRYMEQLRRFLAYCARRHSNTYKPEGRALSDCIRRSRGPFKIAPHASKHWLVSSAFCHRMAPDFVPPASIGYHCTNTRLTVDDVSVELQCFGMIPWTFTGLHCLVLLYDVHARQSFERVESSVREMYRLQNGESRGLPRAFVVGLENNEASDKEREVTPDEGRILAAKLHADIWTEISLSPAVPGREEKEEDLRVRLAAEVLPALRPMAGDRWVKPTAAELDEVVRVPMPAATRPAATRPAATRPAATPFAADGASDKREARCLVQ